MPKYFPVQGEISGLSILTKGEVIENGSIWGTSLNNCSIHPPADPGDRAILRHISLTRIEHYANRAWGAFFDDITVTDIRSPGIIRTFMWGCAYRHVTLRGWIGGLMFRWQLHFRDDRRMEKRYQKANAKLYESMDWAIDVSEAKFTALESLLGIPPHLVRRDPAAQFLLTRASAEVILRDKPRSIWSVVAERLIESPMPGVITIVGSGSQRHKADLALARDLAAEGLLE